MLAAFLVLHWHHCPCCAGVFVIPVLALPHDASMAWHFCHCCTGNISIAVLAFLPLFC
jgi:hypothetical protein